MNMMCTLQHFTQSAKNVIATRSLGICVKNDNDNIHTTRVSIASHSRNNMAFMLYVLAAQTPRGFNSRIRFDYRFCSRARRHQAFGVSCVRLRNYVFARRARSRPESRCAGILILIKPRREDNFGLLRFAISWLFAVIKTTG